MGGGSSAKRFKNFRKSIHFYSQSFAFREPFQVIVDAEFIKEAVSRNQNIFQEIEAVLDGKPLKCMTTECIKTRLRELDRTNKNSQLLSQARKFEVLRLCKHTPSISPCDCIVDLIKGKDACKFFVASNDIELKEKLRAIPGIPIIYSQKGIVFLENPTPLSQSKAKALEIQKNGISLEEKQLLKKLIPIPPKRTGYTKKITKRKSSAPNPLSCKKKKTNKSNSAAS
jgi:U3 small nucleolar RNA-associated protein 23